MSKIIYLLILFILGFGYLEYIPGIILSKDFLLILTWIWGLFGTLMFIKSSKSPLNDITRRKFVFLFFFLMCISTLYPYLYYDQSLTGTLIAQRENYSIIFLLIFLIVHPEENDFIISLKYCSYLTISIIILSIFFPENFLSEERIQNLIGRQNQGSTDLVTASPGFLLLIFYFFIKCSKLLELKRKKDLFEILLLFTIIFLVQNRSTLIIVVPVFIYSILKIGKEQRMFYFISALSLFFVFYDFIVTTILNLWTESIDQLANRDYNRWQAFDFFVLESDINVITFLFGHGVSASGSEYLDIILNAQENRFAFISDIGLFGTFFFYGISFILIIYYLAYRAIKYSGETYLKFYGIFIFLVPTIQNFGVLSSKSAIIYSVFFYLVFYNEEYGSNKLTYELPSQF